MAQIGRGGVRARMVASGRVQGVGFRYELREVAERVGVRGWVRNLADGRVEALIEGDAAAVREVLDWCRAGPPGAAVSGLDVRWEEPDGSLQDFSIRSTPRDW